MAVFVILFQTRFVPSSAGLTKGRTKFLRGNAQIQAPSPKFRPIFMLPLSQLAGYYLNNSIVFISHYLETKATVEIWCGASNFVLPLSETKRTQPPLHPLAGFLNVFAFGEEMVIARLLIVLKSHCLECVPLLCGFLIVALTLVL